jgi:hypothetical protein
MICTQVLNRGGKGMRSPLDTIRLVVHNVFASIVKREIASSNLGSINPHAGGHDEAHRELQG